MESVFVVTTHEKLTAFLEVELAEHRLRLAMSVLRQDRHNSFITFEG